MTRSTALASVAAVVLLAAGVVAWQPEPAPARPRTGAGPTLAGAALFRTKGCATCHTGPDSESGFGGLPDLSDARAWAGRRQPGLSAADYLRTSIREPGVFTSPEFRAADGPVTGMPTLAVSDAEVDALVAYLLAR